MRKAVWAAIGLLTAASLVGCSLFVHPAEEGKVFIRIIRSSVTAMAVEPRLIPAVASHVAVRIWHKQSGVNKVVEVTLPESGSVAVEATVPALSGYTVDAVSYVVYNEFFGFVLTGGRVKNVNVAPHETTVVNIELTPWQYTFGGDTEVESLKEYTVTLSISHKDDLCADFLGEFFANLYTSLENFQSPTATLSPPVDTTDLTEGSATFTATAPEVTEDHILYYLVLNPLTKEWTQGLPPGRSLHLEFPNRALGEPLQQIIVHPASGGIIIGISSHENQ